MIGGENDMSPASDRGALKYVASLPEGVITVNDDVMQRSIDTITGR